MKQEYHRALEQICLSEEARARIISVLEQKERGLKRPRRRIGRLILVCAPNVNTKTRISLKNFL